MWTPGPRRRFGLWLRAKLERLAFLVDMRTAPKYDPATMPHLHLTDEEWADFESTFEPEEP